MARILIIEDHPQNLELMSYLLHAFGHDVYAAVDGLDGLNKVPSVQPDLIVCDLLMPKMDGYEVARRLKGDPALCAIPLVAVSALTMAGDREKGLAAGFDGYIDKPINPRRFVGELERFLSDDRHGVKPSPTSAPQPAAKPAAPFRGTILVVDDSLANRALLASTLKPVGYEVWLCESVAEAMARLTETLPDLILSDLHMPTIDGLAFLRLVKADPRLAPVPFVFVSASLWGERGMDSAMSLGASLFLLRPIAPEQLLAELAALLSPGKA